MIDFLSISITNGILIFLLITVLIFFCLYLYSDNKILKKQIEELRKENKSLLEKKIMNQENVDALSIKNISDEKLNINDNERLNIKEPIQKEDIKNNNHKESSLVNDVSKEITNIKDKKENFYQEEKIPKEEFKYQKLPTSIAENYNNLNNQSINTGFNLSELINKNNSTNLNKLETLTEYNYLEELSNRLNEELKPQTIELTEYEKKQEEQAVISYKELLKFKDNNQLIDEKQETINFIEELKSLRNSLK